MAERERDGGGSAVAGRRRGARGTGLRRTGPRGGDGGGPRWRAGKEHCRRMWVLLLVTFNRLYPVGYIPDLNIPDRLELNIPGIFFSQIYPVFCCEFVISPPSSFPI